MCNIWVCDGESVKPAENRIVNETFLLAAVSEGPPPAVRHASAAEQNETEDPARCGIKKPNSLHEANISTPHSSDWDPLQSQQPSLHVNVLYLSQLQSSLKTKVCVCLEAFRKLSAVVAPQSLALMALAPLALGSTLNSGYNVLTL